MTSQVDSEHSTWESFVSSFTALAPGLTHQLRPETRVQSLLNGDRIVKGLVASAIQRLLYDPPVGLVTPEMTLADVYEWHLSRRSHSETTASRPVDLSGALRAMRSRNIRLRPIGNSDIPKLYESAIDPRWSYRWRYRGATPSLRDFAAELSNGVLSQFIVESIANQAPVGLVACYNARADLGWAYFAYTRVSTASKPVGSEMLEGGLLFISFLFRNWNFRKLYAEVPGWNWDQFTKGTGEFFTQEGVLLEHEYFGGRYWDQHILAFHRRAWETKTALLVDILCPPEPPA